MTAQVTTQPRNMSMKRKATLQLGQLRASPQLLQRSEWKTHDSKTRLSVRVSQASAMAARSFSVNRAPFLSGAPAEDRQHA
jgi:hypothetical protein